MRWIPSLCRCDARFVMPDAVWPFHCASPCLMLPCPRHTVRQSDIRLFFVSYERLAVGSKINKERDFSCEKFKITEMKFAICSGHGLTVSLNEWTIWSGENVDVEKKRRHLDILIGHGSHLYQLCVFVVFFDVTCLDGFHHRRPS